MHKKVSHPDEIQNTIEVILIYNKIILQDRTRDGGSLHVGRIAWEGLLIHHFPYIVDFRSAVWLPYELWSVANTDTRYAPNI